MTRARVRSALLALSAGMAGVVSCNRSDTHRLSTVTQATDSAASSFGCNRPQNVAAPVGHVPAESGGPGHYALTWWLTARFTAVADSVLSLPISSIDSAWSAATVLTREIMPAEAREDRMALRSPNFGFCFERDFNRDGHRDRAAVGVYRTRRGARGRFLLILTEASAGHWQKVFLDTAADDVGFSALSVGRGDTLGWWFCMACDSWTQVVWADTGYLLKQHPGGLEDSDSVNPGADTLRLTSGPPNKRLKLAARVDCGMNLSSARRSLSAIR